MGANLPEFYNQYVASKLAPQLLKHEESVAMLERNTNGILFCNATGKLLTDVCKEDKRFKTYLILADAEEWVPHMFELAEEKKSAGVSRISRWIHAIAEFINHADNQKLLMRNQPYEDFRCSTSKTIHDTGFDVALKMLRFPNVIQQDFLFLHIRLIMNSKQSATEIHRIRQLLLPYRLKAAITVNSQDKFSELDTMPGEPNTDLIIYFGQFKQESLQDEIPSASIHHDSKEDGTHQLLSFLDNVVSLEHHFMIDVMLDVMSEETIVKPSYEVTCSRTCPYTTAEGTSPQQRIVGKVSLWRFFFVKTDEELKFSFAPQPNEIMCIFTMNISPQNRYVTQFIKNH